jgi:glycosyltransferase involved in cell wall biosynthesis
MLSVACPKAGGTPDRRGRTEHDMPEVRRPSKTDARARLAPRLLYVVSDDWYFLAHQLAMARAARAAGFEVHVAATVGEDGAAIEKEGFVLHPVRFARGRLRRWRALRTISALRKVYRTVDPAIVHYVAIEPVLLGIVAAFGRRTPAAYAITGFGAPIGDAKGGALPASTRRLLQFGLNRRGAIGLVETPEDGATLTELGVKPDHIVQMAGSGVDADRLRPIPEPDGPMTVAYVGRMDDFAGGRTMMAAYRMLRQANVPCELLLAGSPEPASPAANAQSEFAAWGREPGVTWLPNVADIATVWRRAHIAVLPSRTDSVPKSLLEAAACARPLIATDVPACRELVTHERTGLLVPVGDPQALAAAILRLARSSPQRVRLGVAARRLVDERFSGEIIGKAAVALYQRLLDAAE